VLLEPLPIDPTIPEVVAALDQHRAAIVIAAPGAGKTTRVPPALVDTGRVILLQPRRSAARAIARRIAEERNWRLGVEVGWHIRGDKHFNQNTALLVATEGILTARLQSDPLLADFSTIVLDEFHERSIHAETAVALAKQALLARDDLRLVVMSATIDAEPLASYLWNCPIIRAGGVTHPLTVTYMPDQPVSALAARALTETTGHVLWFQPGAGEINRCIADLAATVGDRCDVLPLHGSLPADEQDRAIQPSARRRIIVCSNIAETSITVPGVTAVVDTGLEKVARYDASRGIDTLNKERISRASADQRAGRAARTGPGVAYRMWGGADRLKPYREPDIRRVDISGVALAILAWGGDPLTLDWFEPPSGPTLASALELLARLGATDRGRLTRIGEDMARMALPPRLARVVIAAGYHTDAIRLASVLADGYLDPRRNPSSDVMAALDAWASAPAHVRQQATQLEREFGNRRESERPRSSLNEADLRRALLAGYPDRVAKRRVQGDDRFLLASGTGAVLEHGASLRQADMIVALDVMRSLHGGVADGRIRLASSIDPEWLTPTSTSLEHDIDERGAVCAKQIATYGAIRLQESRVPPDPERASEVLAREWLSRPLAEDTQQLLRRLRFAGCDIDLATLAKTAAYGARSLGEIDIRTVLPRNVVSALEAGAPEAIDVPSGRRARLDYAEDGTVSASVKLQELFGLADTPRLGPRHEPLLFVLLAPNGRPVQVTRDLQSFWNRTYPEVRKELRGRYPKHPWPEDPWNAQATHRAKPRPPR